MAQTSHAVQRAEIEAQVAFKEQAADLDANNSNTGSHHITPRLFDIKDL